MKILVVDDNADDRRVLKYIIEAHGHQVLLAGNGKEGLNAAAAEKPDLIISDALMPLVDGFQFLRNIKQDEALAAIPFIFYSATYKGQQDVQLALSLGAAGYIIKPKEPSELWEEVDQILSEEAGEKTLKPDLIDEHTEYLERYSQVVAAKLEEKVKQYELELAERRKVEESLRERDAFIRNILESVDESFIVLDRDYRIISANRAFCNLVGSAESEVVGRHCYDVSHHVSKPCYELEEECAVRHTFETGRAHSTVHTHTDAEGAKQTVEIKSYPITDAKGNVTSAIETINDITEKRKLEEQLRQAQKMEAIGTLAGGVAHDFNNILTAIIGYGNIMKMKMSPDDQGLAPLEQILSAADRAANLTQGLLAFSRKRVLNPRPVDINHVVMDVEKLLVRLIGEDVDLKTARASGDLIVMAEAGQIEQVLMNLATNARDAMPKGGTLSITTHEVELNEDFIAVHGYGSAGKHVMISVADTGCGMDEQTREKIFEPFFTTKELGKGTGLGLAIVYGIIKQHNGFVNVYSEPGQGSTFRIYLPLIMSQANHLKSGAVSRPRGGNETIIIAEDDQTVRDMTTAILSDFGYRVIGANDGQDALDQFSRHADETDLVILDVIMPKKNGYEVYDIISNKRPTLPVLFMSGYSADFLRMKGLFDKEAEFVSKPVKPFELLSKIREMIDRKKEDPKKQGV